MGKKNIDLVTRRDASQGRKSKAGGGKIIKGYGIIYTPVGITNERLVHYHIAFDIFPQSTGTTRKEVVVFRTRPYTRLPYLRVGWQGQ